MGAKHDLRFWLSLAMYDRQEDRRIARILLSTIQFYWIWFLLVMVFDWLWGGAQVALPLGVGCAILLPALALLFRQNLLPSAYLTGSVYIVSVALLATAGEGIHDYVLMAYPAILLYAGLLDQRRGLLFAFLASLASIAWLTLGELYGWYPVGPHHPAGWIDTLGGAALLVIAALAVNLLIANLDYGLAQTWRELAERLRAEAALKQSQARLQALTNATQHAYILLDCSGRILSFNANAARQSNMVTGLKMRENDTMYQHILEADRAEFDAHYARALQGEVVYAEKFFSAPGGGRLAAFTYNPVRSDSGEVTGVCLNTMDITENWRSQQKTRIRLELVEYAVGHTLGETLQRALDEICNFTGSTIGFYHFVDEDQRMLSLQAWSTRTRLEFCSADGEGLHYPLDQAGVWSECVRLRRTVVHNDYAALPDRRGLPPGHATVQREMVAPTFRHGKVVAILGMGNKAVDYTEHDADALAYLSDVVWEVAHRKRTEEQLQEVQALLQRLAENLSDAALFVCNFDTSGMPHYEYLSAGIENLTGVTPAAAYQDPACLYGTLLPEYLPLLRAKVQQSYPDVAPFGIEVALTHARTGEVRWMLLRASPRRLESGAVVWYCVQLDITDKKRSRQLLEDANRQLQAHLAEIEYLHAELREQAIRDPLTGLYNRRYLDDALEREFSRVERDSRPLSVIIMDLDHFKVVNDTYGHQVGDHFLVLIANLVSGYARSSDIACRYGGEELLLVLPGMDAGQACKRAEDLRQAIADLRVPAGGQELQVTISMGVSVYPLHGSYPIELLRKADTALYQSKSGGRNRVTLWETGFENDAE
ncbi:MAG: diguanylate cyclase [Chloroflexota bacterium]